MAVDSNIREFPSTASQFPGGVPALGRDFATYQDKVEAIQAVERAAPVNSLVVNGVRVWPLLRMLVWRKLLHPEQPVFEPMAGPFFPQRLAARPECVRVGEEKTDLEIRRPEILFLCRPEENSDRFQGKYYNRLLDPWMRLFSDRHVCAKVEIASERLSATWPRAIPTECYAPPPGQEDRAAPALRVEGWEAFRKPAEEKLGFPLSESSLLFFFRTVSLYRDYFRALLEAKSPKAVFLTCWYFEVHMAMAWACRDRGVACVDVQHGKQGRFHGMYSHWTEVPAGGYEFMPTHFWTWGKPSSEHILRWFPLRSGLPKALAGGQLWLADWLDGSHPEPGPGFAEFKAKAAGSAKVILVSLQPIDDPLPAFLRQAIADSPRDWLWLIRLHPVHRRERGGILSLLSGLECARDLDAASELPLYALLRLCTHHVTGFSSVGYEALHFGVATGVWSPVAAEMYGSELESGAFVAVPDAERLAGFIAPQAEKRALDTRYILTDKEAALRACEEILRAAERQPETPSWTPKPGPFAAATLIGRDPGQFLFDAIHRVREHGLAILPGFLSGDRLSGVRAEYEKALEQEPPSNYPFGRATRIVGLEASAGRYPKVADLFGDPFMQVTANLFFDEPYVLNHYVYFTHETRTDRGLGLNGFLHFDRNHSLKFFFYLLDTERANGALSCVPGSHVQGRAFREEAWRRDGTYAKVKNRVGVDYPELGLTDADAVPIEEVAGTLIIFDTDLFHRGGMVEPGHERKVLRGHCYPKSDPTLVGADAY